jgi:hypothetical protein
VGKPVDPPTEPWTMADERVPVRVWHSPTPMPRAMQEPLTGLALAWAGGRVLVRLPPAMAGDAEAEWWYQAHDVERVSPD